MYAITKYTNTFNWGISTEISMWSDKDRALDIFAWLVQEELFFLDKIKGFTKFVEKHTENNYSDIVDTIIVWCKSLKIGTYPEGMITIEYYDEDTDVYRFQMVECTDGLSINL